MKKVIKGKRYDTESAVLIGGSSMADGGRNDFHGWEAELYRTPKSGVYFLAGSGGGLTIFAHVIEPGRAAFGRRIIPMEPSEALQWAEDNLPASIVTKEFDDMIEDA